MARGQKEKRFNAALNLPISAEMKAAIEALADASDMSIASVARDAPPARLATDAGFATEESGESAAEGGRAWSWTVADRPFNLEQVPSGGLNFTTRPPVRHPGSGPSVST